MMKTQIQQSDDFRQNDVEPVSFKSGNSLLINREKEELTILGRNQQIQMVISMKDDALTVNVTARQLNINAMDELNLSARKINIEAAEQVSIRTTGNLVQKVSNNSSLEVGGTNKSIAMEQKLVAKLGNVEIKANDDIVIEGERIKLNCD
ncbi:MAG: hypothetical protein ABIY90_13110 [Puia sp.]